MNPVATTPRSIPFGTVLHAGIETLSANDFQITLPHVPVLAKAFGDKFPRITWNVDQEGLRTWQSMARRFVRPYFSEGLDIISSLLETTLTGDYEARRLLEVNYIDPTDIMIAGHLRLFASSSYDRFSAIFPTDVAFPSEYGETLVVNPLTHKFTDMPVFDEPGNEWAASVAPSIDGEISDRWNSWFESGMDFKTSLSHEALVRRMKSWTRSGGSLTSL